MASRSPYTEQEETRMWLFLFEQLRNQNPSALKPKGKKLWEEYEVAVSTDKSPDSLTTHFRRMMLDKPEEANIDVQQILYIVSKLEYRLMGKQRRSIEHKYGAKIKQNSDGIVIGYKLKGRYHSLGDDAVDNNNDATSDSEDGVAHKTVRVKRLRTNVDHNENTEVPPASRPLPSRSGKKLKFDDDFESASPRTVDSKSEEREVSVDSEEIIIVRKKLKPDSENTVIPSTENIPKPESVQVETKRGCSDSGFMADDEMTCSQNRLVSLRDYGIKPTTSAVNNFEGRWLVDNVCIDVESVNSELLSPEENIATKLETLCRFPEISEAVPAVKKRRDALVGTHVAVSDDATVKSFPKNLPKGVVLEPKMKPTTLSHHKSDSWLSMKDWNPEKAVTVKSVAKRSSTLSPSACQEEVRQEKGNSNMLLQSTANCSEVLDDARKIEDFVIVPENEVTPTGSVPEVRSDTHVNSTAKGTADKKKFIEEALEKVFNEIQIDGVEKKAALAIIQLLMDRSRRLDVPLEDVIDSVLSQNYVPGSGE